jgi:catechol 2,3-dioxygenase-like lactoylglutathione lyase family enzyme
VAGVARAAAARPAALQGGLAASLHHIKIASPDPAGLAAFYGSALDMSVSGEAGLFAARGPGRTVRFVEGGKKTLALAAYAVPDAAAIAAIMDRCDGLGVRADALDEPLFAPGAIVVTDPDGHRIGFGVAEAGEARAGLTARLQHVVVASPRAETLSQFYQDAFGFTVSDNVIDEDGGLRTTFLRCGHEHHSFAVFQAKESWFDHHCYEAGDWGLIRDWCDRFAGLGIPIAWGPGRHGPGNNLFLFIHDPDGNWVEISAELELVAQDRPVGIWKHEQKTLNLWGSAPLRS